MNHLDCAYYLAVDVYKGICKRTKETINADDSACDDFEKAPKCRYCKHFSLNGDLPGKCMTTTIAYPDMKATTCKDFSWK